MDDLTKFLLAMARGEEIIITRIGDDRWEVILKDDGFTRTTVAINGEGDVVADE